MGGIQLCVNRIKWSNYCIKNTEPEKGLFVYVMCTNCVQSQHKSSKLTVSPKTR